MKKILFTILAALVVVGAGLAALAFKPGPVFRAIVNSWGPSVTRTSLRLEGAEFTAFSKEATLSGLHVGNPPGYTADQAVSVSRIRITTPKTMSRDHLVLERVDLSGAVFSLEVKDGTDNLEAILTNIDASVRYDLWPEWLKEVAPRRITIQDLFMKDAAVNWIVPLTGGKTMSIPLPDIHLQHIATEGAGFSPAAIFGQVLRQIRRKIVRLDFGTDVSSIFQQKFHELSRFLKNIGTPNGKK